MLAIISYSSTYRVTVIEKNTMGRAVVFTHHVEGMSAVEIDIFLRKRIKFVIILQR